MSSEFNSCVFCKYWDSRLSSPIIIGEAVGNENTYMSNKNIIKNSLKLIKQCPVCNSEYLLEKITVVAGEEDGYLLHFSCNHCANALLVKIAPLPFGVIGSAMLTDLEANEVLKFKNAGTVSVDDVLEVYQNLEGNRVIK